MSDTARKRVLAEWVVKNKKHVVKLYAVAKWSRDADTVQKCMVGSYKYVLKSKIELIPSQNITAFLMNQNQQFEDVVRGLKHAKESLDPARLENKFCVVIFLNSHVGYAIMIC